MFVQWEAPEEVTQPYPVVLIHGGGGQGTDWLGTPDGRPGWATFLLQEGYAVYVVDRPGHGRSPYHPDVLCPPGGVFTLETISALFCGTAQWPGTGDPDDPYVRAFAAGTGPMLARLRAGARAGAGVWRRPPRRDRPGDPDHQLLRRPDGVADRRRASRRRSRRSSLPSRSGRRFSTTRPSASRFPGASPPRR